MKRPKQPMPGFVREALLEHNLMESYNSRPAYQRNDYLGWINNASQNATKKKRLAQMLSELEKGGVYMRMEHPPSRKS